jgi:hypothetical protein
MTDVPFVLPGYKMVGKGGRRSAKGKRQKVKGGGMRDEG